MRMLTKKQVLQKRIELEKLREIELMYEMTHKVEYFKPYPWQQTFLDMAHTKMVLFAPSPNKIGKSVVAICIALSWILGYEPWTGQDVEFENSIFIRKKKRWFRKSSLGIKPPVNIVMCGEDWKEHIGKTLVPILKEWMPVDEFKAPRKNEVGIENYWVHENKSTLTFMCYTQDVKVFESSKFQGLLEDEPPPKEKREGLKRGLFIDRGKEVITATPLSEAYLLDELIYKQDPEIGVMQGLTILDNPDKYSNEKAALENMGLSEAQCKHYFDLLIYDNPVKKTCVKDKGDKAEKYVRSIAEDADLAFMQELDILRFVKSTDPDKAPARFHGTFKALVGKIIKDYDRDIHIIDHFKFPTDSPVIAQIDFHINKPHAIGFYGFDKFGQEYVLGEVWENMPAEEVAYTIIRWKKNNVWNLEWAFIDPLSKGDSAYVKNRLGNVKDSFTIISEILMDEGITLEVGSKDKESGIMNLNNGLKGVNGRPTIFFLDSLPSVEGAYGHLFEILRWVYDDNEKPKKENDHFMETFYRSTLTGIEYQEPDQLVNIGGAPAGQGQKSEWMGA